MNVLKTGASMFLLVALFSFLASGCYRHSYGSPPVEGPPQVVKWSHNILFGIISINGHTASDVCGNVPPVRIATYVGPIGWLLGVATASIYVPTTTLVWCPEPAALGQEGGAVVR